MDKEARRVLTEGLLRGYAGDTKKEIKGRGVFEVSSRDVPLEGGAYIDEWAFGSRTGGGQELVKFWYPDNPERKKATRVYAGGVFAKEALDKFGITPKDVTNYLKMILQKLGAKTRLGNDCTPEADGDWQYVYKVLRAEIPDAIKDDVLMMSLEMMLFKKEIVFAHGFVSAPVE